jgi:hypothetical protein
MKLEKDWELMERDEQRECLKRMTAEFLAGGGRVQSVPAPEATIRYKIPWHTLKRKRKREKENIS